MTQEELIAFLLEMRAAQKSFFKTRDYKELKKARH